jgi:two-component system phosphate regulon sensor histidine kinase PhoR
VIRTDRGQPVVNLVRQPEFVAYLARRRFFSRPLTLRSERGEDRVLSIMSFPMPATDG